MSSASDSIALYGGRPTIDGRPHRLWPILSNADREAVRRVLDRGILSGSFAPEARAFEREFAQWVGARHAVLTHCGTSALQLALAAAGVGAGDEVIVPAYSFVATPMAVLLQGAIPIFCDVDEATGTMDCESARAWLSPHTKAIMPVHVHGAPADLSRVFALAKECGAVVVEDAAQAHGATFEGRPVGALGRAGGFSLQSSKNLSAGEGGVFVTNDDDAWELANRVRNFGQDLKRTDAEHYDLARPLDGHRSLQSIHMGSMYRGNELMAAIARAQLQELGARTRAAQDHAARLSERLAKLPGVHPPRTFASCTSVHHKYRVRFDLAEAGLSGTGVAERTFRDALSLALRREGLEVVLWQDQPLAEMDVFQTRRGFGDGFPFRLADPKRLEANYAKGAYPRTRRLLDSSLLLFSQSFPLIAQDETLVDRYAEAFERVWNARQRIAADAERIVRDARAAA